MKTRMKAILMTADIPMLKGVHLCSSMRGKILREEEGVLYCIVLYCIVLTGYFVLKRSVRIARSSGACSTDTILCNSAI